MNVYTKIAAKSVIFSILIAAYCTADANEHSFSTCSDEPSFQGKRHSILDKALEKYISSGMVKDVAFPDFNETIYLGRLKCYMEFYNATIVSIHFIERVGCNYLEAKLHKNMQIQVGLKLQGLSASISFRKKRSRRYTKALVKIFLPEFLLFAEIQEVGEMLKLARLDISDIEKLKIQFRFLTGMLKIINEKKKLQAYVNKRINKQLHVEIPRAMEGLLKELGRRHTEECVGCTMFDIVLINGLRKFGLDPIALPKITQQLLARLVHVKVTNGNIGGLTRLRQSGDIVTRIDERGAHAFVDMTSQNLSVTFDVYVTTPVTNYTATVSVSISARVILLIDERNTALVLEKLTITTEAVHVSVTPVGVVSSVVTFFMPPEFIADLIKENIEQLTRSTIQSGLDKLRTFAYGGATAE